MRWAGRTWSGWLRRKLDGTGVTWLMSWSATRSAWISLKCGTNLTCANVRKFVGPFRSLMRYLSSERRHKQKKKQGGAAKKTDVEAALVATVAVEAAGDGRGAAAKETQAEGSSGSESHGDSWDSSSGGAGPRGF